MTEFRNWSGDFGCVPRQYLRPSSEDEVAAVLARAAEDGVCVRVVGAGHSWSDIACTHGYLLNLDSLKRVIDVDFERKQITVQAGMRLRELNEIAAGYGLGIPSLGSISEQSVAGVISTGTHGSGVTFGNLATLVVGLRLACADGTIVDIDADHELFSAARISLGSLGIITRVTLQLEPAFRLIERVIPLRFDNALDQLDELLETNEHCKLWWIPHTDWIRVATLNRTDEPRTEPPLRVAQAEALARFFGRDVDLTESTDKFLNDKLYPALLALTRRTPRLTPRVNQLLRRALAVPSRRVDRSDKLFNLAMPPVHREMEYGLPRDCTRAALVEVRELIARHRLYVNFILEVRFTAADDIMISGAYGRQSCQLGAYVGECPSRATYLAEVERLCLGMDGRPHWGKEFAADATTLRRVNPRLDEFDQLRRKLDPDGRFENDFTRRVFGG